MDSASPSVQTDRKRKASALADEQAGDAVEAQNSAKKPRPNEPAPSSLSSAAAKLAELRLRVNASRQLNHQEVLHEDERQHDPKAERKRYQDERRQARREAAAAAVDTHGDVDPDQDQSTAAIVARAAGKAVPTKKTDADVSEDQLLRDSIDAAAWRAGRKAKKQPLDESPAAAMLRSHEKRVDAIPIDIQAYKAYAAEASAQSDLMYGSAAPVPPERIALLKAEMKETAKRRDQFSRRRSTNPDADVNYVNPANQRLIISARGWPSWPTTRALWRIEIDQAKSRARGRIERLCNDKENNANPTTTTTTHSCTSADYSNESRA